MIMLKSTHQRILGRERMTFEFVNQRLEHLIGHHVKGIEKEIEAICLLLSSLTIKHSHPKAHANYPPTQEMLNEISNHIDLIHKRLEILTSGAVTYSCRKR